MAFSKYVITNAGRDLMLACMATGNFKIHSLVLGSGSYSGILSEIQDVVEPVLTFSGDALSVVKRENQLEVRCRLTNEQLEPGFKWREYGVYATDGENTVLYCYDNAGSDPVPISSAGSGAAVSNAIKVIITADQAATVNVSFRPDAAVEVPEPTVEDAGKFLRVNSSGAYTLQTVTAAEGVSF